MTLRHFLCGIALISSLPALRAQTAYFTLGNTTGLAGNPSLGLAINDSGLIGGRRYNGVYWTGFAQDTLGSPQAMAYVLGYNNNKLAVGYEDDGGGARHPAYYDISGSGPSVNLGTLGGTDGVAYSVNTAGDIVGYSKTAGNAAPIAFKWSGGTMTGLGTLGGNGSIAYEINSSGQIVGTSDVTGNSGAHAFLTTGHLSGGTDLGTLGGTNSVALGINSFGHVVGYSDLAGNAVKHAFLYTGGAMADLGTVAGFTSSAAEAINGSGVVVGNLTNATGPSHAFVYANGVMYDLNTLFDPSVMGVGSYFAEAYGINSSGQIVGTMYVANISNSSTFVLTPTGTPLPIPEPATYALLAGLLAFGLTLRRRTVERARCSQFTV